MEYNRYSVQVLGTVDAQDAVALHQAIKAALLGINKFKVKMIGLDEWVDGLGVTRIFNEEGKEVIPEPEVIQEPETTIEVTEVVA